MFLVIDRLTAPCDGAPPACYTLAYGNAPQLVHYHWENADGSPATEMIPQSGTFAQDFGFFTAAETVVPFALDTDPNDVGNDLAVDLAVVSDFSAIEDLLVNGQWAPNGSVWYAHACCSAGATGGSVYSGLFAAGTENGDMLVDVARAGPAVAPLPTALLSAPRTTIDPTSAAQSA